MKQVTLWLTVFTLGAAVPAQTGTVTDQLDQETLTQTVETSIVPAGPDSTRSESVTRSQLGPNRLVETQRTRSVTEMVAPGITRTTVEIEDLAGRTGEVTARRTTESVTTTDSGESRETAEYQRLGADQFVLSRSSSVTTTIQPDGSRLTQRVDKRRDAHGAMVVDREIATQTVARSAIEEVSTSRIRSKNKLTGQFEEIAREQSTARTEGNTVRTDREMLERRDGNWRVTARVEDTETRSPGGTVLRETIRYRLPQFALAPPTAAAELRPALKIVERLTPTAGRTVPNRVVYRRDVNNEWVPVTFSVPYEY